MSDKSDSPSRLRTVDEIKAFNASELGKLLVEKEKCEDCRKGLQFDAFVAHYEDKIIYGRCGACELRNERIMEIWLSYQDSLNVKAGDANCTEQDVHVTSANRTLSKGNAPRSSADPAGGGVLTPEELNEDLNRGDFSGCLDAYQAAYEQLKQLQQENIELRAKLDIASWPSFIHRAIQYIRELEALLDAVLLTATLSEEIRERIEIALGRWK